MKILTFPMRPMSGGRLESALPLVGGAHLFSRKLNGWRAEIHTPSGTMFNRRGEELSIAKEFTPALGMLRNSLFQWLDCEVLERRHNLGRGSIVVLDVIAALPADQRYAVLKNEAGMMGWERLPMRKPEDHTVYVMDQATVNHTSELTSLWEQMQKINQELGEIYYEGLVGKRADSPYPMNTVDPDRTTPTWIKYRFIK